MLTLETLGYMIISTINSLSEQGQKISWFEACVPLARENKTGGERLECICN